MQNQKPTTVDEYINSAPKEAQVKLHELREILREVVPNAKELLKWGSPVFEEGRILFAYSFHKDHINFMPTPKEIELFQNDLKDYVTGKTSIQFTFDNPLPKKLIQKIATYRAKDVKENDARWM